MLAWGAEWDSYLMVKVASKLRGLLLSHPSPLPLISQSNKHHKEPMFIYIYIYIYIYITQYIHFTSLCLHILFQKFIIFPYTGDFLWKAH